MRSTSLLATLAASCSLALFACSSGVTIPEADLPETGELPETGGSDAAVDTTKSDGTPGSDADAPASETDETGSTETGTGETSVDDASDTGTVDTGTVDTGTVDTGGPKSCTVSTGGCGPTEYCDAPACGTGTCKPRMVAKPGYAPVCGCDGVSYWNREYASSLGASTKAATGECGTVDRKACGGLSGAKCPRTSDKCIEERSGGALGCTLSDGQGACWAWPDDANCVGIIGFGGQFKRCSGGSGKCLQRCDAIKDDKPFYTDATCPV